MDTVLTISLTIREIRQPQQIRFHHWVGTRHFVTICNQSSVSECWNQNMCYSGTKWWNTYSVLIRDIISELHCKYSVLSTESGTQCTFWADGRNSCDTGISWYIETCTLCYQTQTILDDGTNTMMVEKVSVKYGTLLGIVRYQVCHVLYNIWNTSVRSIKLI